MMNFFKKMWAVPFDLKLRLLSKYGWDLWNDKRKPIKNRTYFEFWNGNTHFWHHTCVHSIKTLQKDTFIDVSVSLGWVRRYKILLIWMCQTLLYIFTKIYSIEFYYFSEIQIYATHFFSSTTHIFFKVYTIIEGSTGVY